MGKERGERKGGGREVQCSKERGSEGGSREGEIGEEGEREREERRNDREEKGRGKKVEGGG